MTHPPSPSEASKPSKPKRIISKAAYFRHVGKKAWLLTATLTTLTIGVGVGCYHIKNLIDGKWQHQLSKTLGTAYDPITPFFVICMIIAVPLAYLSMAKKNWKELKEMESVEPVTRHNIAQMPAEETLVRASQEPTVGQEKVLLRAATAPEETKTEELLRATQKS
jgi:hypothetical protein